MKKPWNFVFVIPASVQKTVLLSIDLIACKVQQIMNIRTIEKYK